MGGTHAAIDNLPSKGAHHVCRKIHSLWNYYGVETVQSKKPITNASVMTKRRNVLSWTVFILKFYRPKGFIIDFLNKLLYFLKFKNQSVELHFLVAFRNQAYIF
jgi:hypothetical protein